MLVRMFYNPLEVDFWHALLNIQPTSPGVTAAPTAAGRGHHAGKGRGRHTASRCAARGGRWRDGSWGGGHPQWKSGFGCPVGEGGSVAPFMGRPAGCHHLGPSPDPFPSSLGPFSQASFPVRSSVLAPSGEAGYVDQLAVPRDLQGQTYGDLVKDFLYDKVLVSQATAG
jgi:hypothetical protein